MNSLNKLLKHSAKKKRVKAILRPFERLGFQALKARRILSIKKDGFEELDYTLEKAIKRKALTNMFNFDSLGYRKRLMHEQNMEAMSFRNSLHTVTHHIPQVKVTTSLRPNRNVSVSPSKIRLSKNPQGLW